MQAEMPNPDMNGNPNLKQNSGKQKYKITICLFAGLERLREKSKVRNMRVS